MTYKPKPIDTSNVQLPDELENLTELLSENTHEIWAQGRINDGWTYGEVRNDENLEHPCLVPYDQLPESEKAYDRNTAMEALKTIQHLGYQIIPPTSGSGSADYQDEARKIILRMEDKSLDLHRTSGNLANKVKRSLETSTRHLPYSGEAFFGYG